MCVTDILFTTLFKRQRIGRDGRMVEMKAGFVASINHESKSLSDATKEKSQSSASF